MNLLNKLTIKSLLLNKKRTIVTIVGIMLSVALITAVSSIYTSGIDSLIKYERKEKGNFRALLPVRGLQRERSGLRPGTCHCKEYSGGASGKDLCRVLRRGKPFLCRIENY